jgi:hypothetical protein
MNMIESVKLHEDFSQVVSVTDLNGFTMNYLMTDGVLIPGRIWISYGPDKERVSLFLPMPDGAPSVLAVALP